MQNILNARTALVAGPTGSVGRALVTQLLADPRYSQVKVLTRRSLQIQHPKLLELTLQSPVLTLGSALTADTLFCCLGTTLKQAGSKAAFEAVDYHLTLEIARAAHTQGVDRLVIISSMSASERSLAFYSRVKGRVEQAVAEVGFSCVQIVRPSLLLSPPRPDSRPAEALGQKLAPLVKPLFKGKWAKFAPIDVIDVAAAMITLDLRPDVGVGIHTLPLGAG